MHAGEPGGRQSWGKQAMAAPPLPPIGTQAMWVSVWCIWGQGTNQLRHCMLMDAKGIHHCILAHAMPKPVGDFCWGTVLYHVAAMPQICKIACPPPPSKPSSTQATHRTHTRCLCQRSPVQACSFSCACSASAPSTCVGAQRARQDGATPLMAAAEQGYQGVVGELLDAGASVHTARKVGQHALAG